MSDSEDEAQGQLIRIVFVGEPSVGKTSIVRRFCNDVFARQYTQTMGADFQMKRLVMPGKKEIVLKLTDVGGQAITGQMMDKYLFKADMIIMVYDITSISSFEYLYTWIDTISNIITSPPFSAIVGNKCDLEHNRAVPVDRTKQFIKEFGFYDYLVSAKSGDNVNMCMYDLVAKHIGMPLSKLQREQQRGKAKAELSQAISQATEEAVARRKKRFK